MYDVFISYSHHDEHWARRVFNDLKGRLLQPFMDEPNLRKGEDWRNELNDAIEDSNHVVALWSAHAKSSQVCQEELTAFYQRMRTAKKRGVSSPRIIILQLDDSDPPYSHLQQFTDFREAGVYDGIASQVDEDLWSRVLGRVYEELTNDQQNLPIRLLVFTTTRDRLEGLDSSTPPAHRPFACSLDDLLRKVGLTKDQLLERYSTDRSEWKPLDGTCGILTLLDQGKTEVNRILTTPPIRWTPIGRDFWVGDQAKAEKEARKLWTGLAVIVLDPIAFYDADAYGRLEMLEKVLDNPLATVLVLPPLRMADSMTAFRDQVQKLWKRIFDYYYEPQPQVVSASCNFVLGDELAIKRSLLASLWAHVYRNAGQEPHPALTMGATQK